MAFLERIGCGFVPVDTCAEAASIIECIRLLASWPLNIEPESGLDGLCLYHFRRRLLYSSERSAMPISRSPACCRLSSISIK